MQDVYILRKHLSFVLEIKQVCYVINAVTESDHEWPWPLAQVGFNILQAQTKVILIQDMAKSTLLIVYGS